MVNPHQHKQCIIVKWNEIIHVFNILKSICILIEFSSRKLFLMVMTQKRLFFFTADTDLWFSLVFLISTVFLSLEL